MEDSHLVFLKMDKFRNIKCLDLCIMNIIEFVTKLRHWDVNTLLKHFLLISGRYALTIIKLELRGANIYPKLTGLSYKI